MTKRDLLEKIAKEIKICQKCRLYRTSTQGVPGEGSENAEIVFIGEAPGYYEDQQGRPFVGRAGALLEELLKKIGKKRSDVYITNVVKHRPLDNRDPFPDEIRACKRYLDQQLETINPKIVVALGRFSLKYFFPNASISKEHGIPKISGKRIIYPVYHPAAALRSDSVKKTLERDFLKISKILSGEITPEEPELKKENEDQISLF